MLSESAEFIWHPIDSKKISLRVGLLLSFGRTNTTLFGFALSAKGHFSYVGHDTRNLYEMKANRRFYHDDISWFGGNLHNLFACFVGEQKIQVLSLPS